MSTTSSTLTGSPLGWASSALGFTRGGFLHATSSAYLGAVSGGASSAAVPRHMTGRVPVYHAAARSATETGGAILALRAPRTGSSDTYECRTRPSLVTPA